MSGESEARKNWNSGKKAVEQFPGQIQAVAKSIDQLRGVFSPKVDYVYDAATGEFVRKIVEPSMLSKAIGAWKATRRRHP